MKLALHTDLSLRLLVYLGGAPQGQPLVTSRIAEQLQVSRHHMHKVAQGLRRLGYVGTVSGRSGGLQLALRPEHICIGDVVEALERSGKLVDCRRGPCSLRGACLLKTALDAGERVFLNELKKYTLADVLQGPTLVRIARLLQAA